MQPIDHINRLSPTKQAFDDQISFSPCIFLAPIYLNAQVLQENVLYKTTTTGWQHIDLSSYHLRFKHLDKIAVTLHATSLIQLYHLRAYISLLT